jgi:hypothetical protein
MTEEEKNTLFKVGGFILAAYFANKILQKLGVIKTDAEIENENAALNSNAWDRNFWKTTTKQHLITQSSAEDISRGIYDSLGWFSDDAERIIALIRQFQYKSEVSFLSDVFAQKYQLDLYQYLKTGNSSLPYSGLSTSNLNLINKYVNALPNG